MSKNDVKERGLRTLLLEAIEQVKDGTLDPGNATAVANLSEAVLSVDRFELEKAAFFVEHSDKPELQVMQPLAIEHQEDEKSDEEEEPSDQEPKELPARDRSHNLILEALVRSQPMELEEVSAATKIPKSECFRVLKDESFERDSDGMYWLAKS